MHIIAENCRENILGFSMQVGVNLSTIMKQKQLYCEKGLISGQFLILKLPNEFTK